MKLYKKVVVPEKIEDVRNGLLCDLCGKKSPDNYNWTVESFSVSETKLKIETQLSQREGSNYPEGGMGTEYEIDLCPECFKNRLVPWLQSEGAKIEERDWEY